MQSKYPGTCARCNKPFQVGTMIKYFGRGRGVEHVDCYPVDYSKPSAPCWICGNPNGFFRNLGPATPVWCDACFAKESAKTATVGNVRFTRRDNSSAEDSCCGDAAYEDSCAAVCGL